MAKDGTARGGARAGSGRKSKALSEKLNTGNPGGRKLTVMELPADADLSGEDMPEVKSYMKDRQKNGEDFDAEEIFEETWRWLKERGCEKLVSVQMVRNYAMSVSRWIQCEHAISEYGFLAKHPTAGTSTTMTAATICSIFTPPSPRAPLSSGFSSSTRRRTASRTASTPDS